MRPASPDTSSQEVDHALRHVLRALQRSALWPPTEGDDQAVVELATPCSTVGGRVVGHSIRATSPAPERCKRLPGSVIPGISDYLAGVSVGSEGILVRCDCQVCQHTRS
jgi:hypothetical protein